MRWGTLFSGVGGVEFGLQAAGHRAVWAVEMDATAADYHRRNHPTTTVYEADVTAVDVTELANIDCLWASPPCQGHSTARRSDLPVREDVWVGRDILRYVAELQPRVVMIENVPGYASHPVCKEITAALWEMGYTVESHIIDCADYGIPQTRKRLIIQARRDGQLSWPKKTQRRMGWYEAIADILPPPEKPLAPWQAKRWDAAYQHSGPVLLDGQFIYDSGKDGNQVLNLIPFGKPAPTIMASDHSAKYIVYPSLTDNQTYFGEDGIHLIHPESPASTVMATEKSAKWVITDGPMRARLNAACSARLQTFPDDVILPDSFSKAIRLIGNAVPPRLAQLLAACAEAGAQVWQGSLFEMEVA